MIVIRLNDDASCVHIIPCSNHLIGINAPIIFILAIILMLGTSQAESYQPWSEKVFQHVEKEFGFEERLEIANIR